MEIDTAMTRIRNSIILLFVFVVAAFAIWLTAAYISANEIRGNSLNEQQWVDRAIELHAGPTERGREALLQAWVPVVVHLPELVCVAFKLKQSALGGEATVCFSKADGSVVINHSEGQ